MDGLSNLWILEAARILGLAHKTRIYQVSTSKLYGLVQQWSQLELTPFYPRSLCAVAKIYGYWITVSYREAYSVMCLQWHSLQPWEPPARRNLCDP